MSENHNGMDETHPTSPRTLATPTRFLVAARAPQRTSPTACPREADERDLWLWGRMRPRWGGWEAKTGKVVSGYFSTLTGYAPMTLKCSRIL